MDKGTKIQFRYFSGVFGHVVPRYGTRQFIGVTRTKDGWEWDEDAIIAIPERDCRKYEREYQRVLRDGAMKKRTEQEYDAQIRALDDTTDISTGDADARATQSKKKDKKGAVE